MDLIDKWQQMQQEMQELGILEKDIVEKFILGSGRGGQKINKTSSCVYLKHVPTGIEIKCQQQRSREHNRYLARKQLCDQIKEKKKKAQDESRFYAEKKRRQKRRRTRLGQEKVLREKKRRSEKKSLRRYRQEE